MTNECASVCLSVRPSSGLDDARRGSTMESDDDDVGRGRDREGEADEEVDDTVALLSDVRDDVAGDGTATRERSRERGGRAVEEGARCVRFRVDGMTCAACVRAVEEAMRGVDDVTASAASCATGEATATVREGADVARVGEAVVCEVEACGFECEVVREERSGVVVRLDVRGMRCAACSTSVEKTLRDARGVSSASVSMIPEGTAVIAYDPHVTGVRDLIAEVEDMGFEAGVSRGDAAASETKRRDAEARQREELKTSAAFTVPIILSNLIFERIWSPKLVRGLSMWVIVRWALATKVQFGVGMRFHHGAVNSLKRGASNMDVLVSLATNVAYGVSVLSIFHCVLFGSMLGRDYFDTSAMLITFILIGKYLEMTARGETTAAITKLLELAPRNAVLMTPSDGDDDAYAEKDIDVDLVQVGDLLKVLPGAKVPTDGVVVRGEAFINESMVTGETMPVTKKVDGQVMSGSINEGNAFVMRAEKIGADSALYQIVRLVEEAQLVKAPIQAFADRVSNIFVPLVVTMAAITFCSWLIAGWAHSIPDTWIPENENQALFAMMFGISVLVTACPCALGLATPTAIMVGTSVAATNGIVIKGGDALERAGNLDVVVFDKTGTLTTGSPTVTAFESAQPENLERIISLVVCVEKDSEHPVAKAVRDYGRRQSPAEIPASSKSQVQVIPGQGVCCAVGGKTVALGNERLMKERGMILSSDSIAKFTSRNEEEGNTVVFVGIEGSVEGAFAVSDELKSDAQETVEELHERGIATVMVTGDNWKTARAVANKCRITNIHAEASPSDKVKIIKELQSKCSPRSTHKFKPAVVAMVGDGINDAPSLACASLAMAIGAGADVAIEAADFVLMRADLHTVVRAVDISQKTFAQIRQNYIWALGYNIVTLPLAAGVFYPKIRVAPWLASILMACSSISVVVASLSLNRKCKESKPPTLRGIKIRN